MPYFEIRTIQKEHKEANHDLFNSPISSRPGSFPSFIKQDQMKKTTEHKAWERTSSQYWTHPFCLKAFQRAVVLLTVFKNEQGVAMGAGGCAGWAMCNVLMRFGPVRNM